MYLTKHRKANQLAPADTFWDLRSAVDGIFGDMLSADNRSHARAWAPAVDIQETDEAFVLEVDLPGLKREDIDLALEEDTVTITGERKREESNEENGARRTERRYGRFQRAFRIPDGFENDKVEGQYTDGVLRVVLPKRQEAKRKRIEVKVK
jgi:HSP20 family protein